MTLTKQHRELRKQILTYARRVGKPITVMHVAITLDVLPSVALHALQALVGIKKMRRTPHQFGRVAEYTLVDKNQDALCQRILQHIADLGGTPVSRLDLTNALGGSMLDIVVAVRHLSDCHKIDWVGVDQMGSPTYTITGVTDHDTE